MDRLIEALRRNPDAVAIAVLCLTFGIGRHLPRASEFHNTRPAIHWIRSESQSLLRTLAPSAPPIRGNSVNNTNSMNSSVRICSAIPSGL
jgi:hypothetical protein